MAVPGGGGAAAAAGYEAPTDEDTEDDVIELGRIGSGKDKSSHKRSRFSLHHAPSKEITGPKPTYEVRMADTAEKRKLPTVEEVETYICRLFAIQSTGYSEYRACIEG